MGNAVIHFEINSKMPEQLHEFYTKVFGWTVDTNNPIGYGIVDTKAGTGIRGGIGPAPDDVPNMVTWYIGVPDTDAALKAVEANGGTTIMPTTEVMPEPQPVVIAMFADPQGNAIGLVKDTSDAAPEEYNASAGGGKHPIDHFEVMGTDGKALQRFYADTFGWEITEMGDEQMTYGTVAPVGGVGIGGGIGQSRGEPTVTFYVATDDVAGTLNTIEQNGGKIAMEPQVMPGVVEFAAFNDPEGNLIGLAKDLSG